MKFSQNFLALRAQLHATGALLKRKSPCYNPKMLLTILWSAISLASIPCIPVDFCQPRAMETTEVGCFHSPSAKTNVTYAVTFPSGYSFEKNLAYAIFLHGRGGNERQFSDLAKAAGTPILVVSPKEPQHSYWKNGAEGTFQTAKMVAEDLRKHIEEKLRRKFEKSSRGIFGISMGGHGALFVADLYPEIFGKVFVISPVFRTETELLPEDREAFGQGSAFNRQDPIFRFHRNIKEGQAGFGFERNFRMEIGRDDPFLKITSRTKSFLEEIQLAYPGQVRLDFPGAHRASYWKRALERGLRYFFEELKAPEGPMAGC